MVFLDSVMGFLFRCTDFYKINQEGEGIDSPRVGMKEGTAENMLMTAFKRWKEQGKVQERSENEKGEKEKEMKGQISNTQRFALAFDVNHVFQSLPCLSNLLLLPNPLHLLTSLLRPSTEPISVIIVGPRRGQSWT